LRKKLRLSDNRLYDLNASKHKHRLKHNKCRPSKRKLRRRLNKRLISRLCKDKL
jgi:hypothetical protein